MDELARYIEHGREERDLEYKRTLHWADPAVRDKITKSILGMANIPDGGVIVLGMAKKGESYERQGMPEVDADSFKQDDVSLYVSKFADPFVEITLRHVPYDGKRYVVIQIREFDEIPVICKRPGAGLRAGAVYTRSRRKHETIEVPSQVEMREIIERAVDKGIRKQRERMERAWVPSGPETPDDSERFAEELKDLE